MAFIPVTMEELLNEEIYCPDFVVVSADAYVDHPSFGHAIVARLVQSQGFSVAIIAQPQTDEDFMRFGEPTYGFLVSSGVVDSMVNNYSVALRPRDEDVYSEGGKPGKRPDRATIVHTKALRRLFPKTPIIIGGIEPSLRRLSHFDYWSNTVMHSILFDAPADLLIYGMGENPLMELCEYAHKNVPLNKVKDIRGTAYLVSKENASGKVSAAIMGEDKDFVLISSHDRVSQDKKLYAKAFTAAFENTDPFTGKGIIQKQDYERYAVVNRPALPLTEAQMDKVYSLPYERKAHPMYTLGVPAIEEVEFSVTAHRGCYGNCSFCALTFHQGKIIQARSNDSIIDEVEKITKCKDFKGYIHDIGGPSANFHTPACQKQLKSGTCKDRECIGFEACPNLQVTHEKYLDVLRRARSIKGVKKVFIRSGIRYDYLMMDKDRTFFNELVEHHVSGQLKVAPEHCSENVLSIMNKPAFFRYKEFYDTFYKIAKSKNINEFLVPYFISSHPGCTLEDAVSLTEYLMEIGYMPKQVQDFYPTPSTLATTMYYTELNPKTGESIFVAKSPSEKAMQRALLQYRLPRNKKLVELAFNKTKREDLISKL